MPIEELLARLRGVTGQAPQWYARCPAHDDHSPSLSVAMGDNGRILMKCHAGCAFEDILTELGLVATDLLPRETAAVFSTGQKAGRMELITTYFYHDDAGQVVYRKQRYRKPDGGKTFFYAQPDGKGGWQRGKGDAPHVLYRLPQMLVAPVVFLVEGEKDVETLSSLGLVATSSPLGAQENKWPSHFTEWFRNKEVVILQDNDDIGKRFAITEANAIRTVACKVSLLDLTRVCPNLPEKGDITDLVTQVGRAETLRLLEQLVKDTPVYDPRIESPVRKLRVRRMSEVKPKRAEYLLYPYLPKGKLTIMGGISGSTKTWAILDWAATISRGREFITDDEMTPSRDPSVVVYQTKENDLETDIRPRLDKLEADLDNIVFIDDHDADGQGFPLSLTDGRIEQAAEEFHPAMIVFDPIQSYLGETVDMHRANEVRPVLDKLIDIARRHNCAVVLVSHMSKDTTKGALDRLLGSSDFRNAARSIVIIGSDPEASDYPHTRVMAHAKNSLGRMGQSIRYHINEYEGVAYDGFCELDEDEIVRPPLERQNRGRPAVSLTRAMEALDDLLGKNRFFTLEQMDTLRIMEGMSETTLARARRELALQRISIGQPPHRKTWWLSPDVDKEKFRLEHTPPSEQMEVS